MHALLEPGTELVAAARIQGRLYDLGAFPGLAPGRRGEWVHGELYRIADAESARLLDALDRYEGQAFRREVREVEDARGARVSAWVYFFAGSVRGRRRIASGDYLSSAASRGEPAARRE